MPPEAVLTLREQNTTADATPGSSFADRSCRSIWHGAVSFPVVLALALAVLTVLTVRDRFNDPDLWWHLKTGEIIWNTHSIPQTDLFSFTTNQHAWTAHEWLSQVTIYGAWRLWDYQGLMLWLCVFGSLLFIGQYALCSLYSGNAKVALSGRPCGLVVRDSRPGDPPANPGIPAAHVRTAHCAFRPEAQRAMVSAAAASLLRVGKLPRIFLRRARSAGRLSILLVVQLARGIVGRAPVGENGSAKC